MQVGFTEDQLQFRDVVSRFLNDKSPPTAVRALMESEQGYDTKVWQQLSQEVALLGTHLPEAYGGFGFGPIELGIIAQEMGRHLYCGPYFASAVMAGYAILNSATEEAKERLLPEIAAGTKIAALALDDLSGADAVGDGIKASGGRLNGAAAVVVDAHVADSLIVVAGTSDGLSLYEVAPAAVSITALDAIDPTRKLARVSFEDCEGELISGPGTVDIDLLWDQMSTTLAHEMIGGAERLFETTIEYMKMRVQFGRQIGSFQSLKHRCADLLLELELAKAMTHEAGRFMASGEGDAYSPNMAKALASDAYLSVAKQAIQLRGGIGFTWEEDTHLWFKRAKASEMFLGSPNWHRERMMQRMEATANV
ncbi:MAG: acyl-CoA dehydrogenase [Pseudomonadales bacterium]|nr:acyl-CoA dehydrogenase [Pseudomonadales bacterium]